MLHMIVAALDGFVSDLQTWLYVDVVQPVMFKVGLMDYDEDTYDALYWVIVGALQVVAMYVLLRPLEALRPVEQWANRKEARVDVIYTLIAKLGIFNLFFFFAMQPLFDNFQAWLRLFGISNVNLDYLWPGVTSKPIVAFAIYLIVLDFAGYWYHRWQHRIGVWWELHAVHHSQRQMSLWCDDRNHLLDDVIQACFFAAIALVIGVSPSQFVVLTAVTNFVQSIQHTNARLSFGRLGERLFVSPTFHRRHHAVGYGHEGTKYGCNFGVLFPWWDMLFRTASWSRALEPTGIREQYDGVSYGDGFWAQHGLAFMRIARRLAPKKPRGAASA
ncbi:sterol desaturase family protein [Burkholderia oklahomensis]|uniref:Fatty acid hydroxylase superfamily protein n=1 Tax=Burkholderia oklahomensis TaxID=342113 RepID=A0AAI8B539_9BURK|nr:sterol desaturase family protein [Burkholderia oklahomensis]AIO65785.1 fatty acid hydroxylase superfamily protein [Burkholderia oklahomensis]AJX31826.1 fatty acid hydroxylase superfamily protein [Burkholderia oklahomensis C6786]AOI41869.1 fatty acid hydroxylase [Burkholderia oklahomensis EO147]AOI45460.1 fatty acid hydroxylase [Burkholderia oklahomensis C6786]KUY49696.1 fatty acid hydroxylase [Burkholderia oklahomensis EO147]